MKLSAFDYAFISYNISSTNQVINRVTLTDNLVINKWEYSRDKIHSFSVGMPIPYMLFGLKETINEC
jgi:hypothetical protein